MNAPGDGALFCWDVLGSLDLEWAQTGAPSGLTTMNLQPGGQITDVDKRLKEVGEEYGAPDYGRRTLFRAVVDGGTSWRAGSAPTNTATPLP